MLSYCIILGHVCLCAPQTILHRYTVGHAIAYNMALSHWALTLYEDTAAFHYIVNSVSEGEVLAAVRPDGVPAPDRDRIKPGTAGTGLYVFYMAHHVLTIAAFWFVQTTRELASMTTFGLLYEGPVIFATIRETIVSFDKEFNLLARVNRRWFFANWVATFVCWVLCRLPASLVFAVYSIWYYWDVMVKEVSLPARVSFWIFGTMFSIISFYWLLLLLIFYLSDRRRFAELDGGRSTA